MVISNEEESRSLTGRQPRMPPDDGPIRRSARLGSSQVSLKEFWEEVTEGRLGIDPLPTKTPTEVEKNRQEAALLPGQLISLPHRHMVCIVSSSFWILGAKLFSIVLYIGRASSIE